MELINNLPQQGNVLFVSNGCGGGHIQTMNSLQAQLRVDRPHSGPQLSMYTKILSEIGLAIESLRRGVASNKQEIFKG